MEFLSIEFQVQNGTNISCDKGLTHNVKTNPQSTMLLLKNYSHSFGFKTCNDENCNY